MALDESASRSRGQCPAVHKEATGGGTTGRGGHRSDWRQRISESRRERIRPRRLRNLDANPLVSESLDRREAELKAAIEEGDATRARQLMNPMIAQSQKMGLSTQAGMRAGNIVFANNRDVQRLEAMNSPEELRQFAYTQRDWAGRNPEKKQEVQDWLESLPDEQLRWLSDTPGGHPYGSDASIVLRRSAGGGSGTHLASSTTTPAPSPTPEFAPASVRDVRNAMGYPPGEFQTLMRNQGIARQVGTDDILTGEEIEQILSKPGLGIFRGAGSAEVAQGPSLCPLPPLSLPWTSPLNPRQHRRLLNTAASKAWG